jgi:hypothetical protein
VEAWEFQEEQFFQVAGGGGTVASSVLRLAKDMLEKRFDPSRYNAYLFLCVGRRKRVEDREAAGALLEELAGKINFTGYVQTDGSAYRPSETQMIELFRALQDKGLAAASARLASMDDVWNAIASSSANRRSSGMSESLEEYSAGLEALAKKLGLDYYPVDFELAPASLMTEIAVYGLPVRCRTGRSACATSTSSCARAWGIRGFSR